MRYGIISFICFILLSSSIVFGANSWNLELVDQFGSDKGGAANDVYVNGNIAYLCVGNYYLSALDISDPFYPTEITRIMLSSSLPKASFLMGMAGVPAGIPVSGNYAYVVYFDIEIAHEGTIYPNRAGIAPFIVTIHRKQ